MAVSIAVVRPGAMSSVGSPTTEHQIRWRSEKNGPGSGQFSIAMDDPLYGDIEINDVAKITRDSDLVASILIEKIHERTLDAQGGARQVATYSGRLVGAFLEWALVAPALGDQTKPIEEDAVFDSSSPRYNPANDPWDPATEIMTVTAAKAGGWPTTPMGLDFTDSTGASMIWDASGDETSAPGGTDLFYEDVTVISGRHVLEVLMDNDGYVRVDGTQVLEIHQNDGYHRVSFKRIDLTAGTHRLWFQVRNINGPGALAYNLFKADQQDRPMPGEPVVAMSSASTQVLAYPDPFPGMTVGEILRDLLAEADDRGALTWINPTFDDDDDSNGDPWDREVGITTKTGTTTLLQFMDELAASGRISRWRMRPNGTSFDVFAPGYSTRPGNVELDPAPVTDPDSGQIVELDRVIT